MKCFRQNYVLQSSHQWLLFAQKREINKLVNVLLPFDHIIMDKNGAV